jgi:hypothetical protein
MDLSLTILKNAHTARELKCTPKLDYTFELVTPATAQPWFFTSLTDVLDVDSHVIFSIDLLYLL